MIGRKRQDRRKPVNRRPKFYWTNHGNLKRELEQFWVDCGVEKSSERSRSVVLIPSEILLYHYGRHDLRAAIVTQGGRSVLAETLPARIMPGRWKDAVTDPTCREEMQQLLKADSRLSMDISPAAALDIASPSRQELTARQEETSVDIRNDKRDQDDDDDSNTNTSITQKKTKHNNIGNRRPRGYWSLEIVLVELYQHVDDVRRKNGRPSVWMPRPNELAAAGRNDLRAAMIRFGGSSSRSTLSSSSITRMAGMIPFREWYYFEGQYELLTLLKAYLDEFHNGNYAVFPCVSEIQRRCRGNNASTHVKLHSLIQFYGGRKFLSARLSMKNPHRDGSSANNNKNKKSMVGDASFLDMNWGPFDLDFGIRLLAFIRQDLMRKSPPMQRPVIAMPTRSKLLKAKNKTDSTLDKSSDDGIQDEGAWLDKKIQEYGGYENVARRLGLAFFE